MRIVVTGGAGFAGSHLCDALIRRGEVVVCVDDLPTGNLDNIADLIGHRRLRFVQADVCAGPELPVPVNIVAHLASPASPPGVLRRPFETRAVGGRGTENALRLALRSGACFVLASTSEVPRAQYMAKTITRDLAAICAEAWRFQQLSPTGYRPDHRRSA